MGTVMAVCTSAVKGIQKTETESIILEAEHGVKEDAHAGSWHRQVSLLPYESIEAFKALGAEVENGSFGENIIVKGIDFTTLEVGSQIVCNDVILELSQFGKECHAHCAIYHKMGDCIMPRKGVFARVLKGGTITVGDNINPV